MIRIARLEKLLFLLTVFIHAIPLFQHDVFLTIDGPAHLYNSNIIHHLWFSDNIFDAAFKINPETVPNWTGHFILFLFNLVLDPFLSEKFLQFLLVTGLPLSFRYALIKWKPANMYWSYFVIPFSYSFVFINGFYNFSLSLIFFFLALGHLAVIFSLPFSVRKTFMLWFLIILTYLSHPFTFIYLTIAAGLFYLVSYPFGEDLPKVHIIKIRKKFILNGILLTCLFIIPLLQLKSFLGFREHTEEEIRFTFHELLNWLGQYRPLILYSGDEVRYTNPLLFALLLSFLWIVYEYFFTQKTVFGNNDRWLKTRICNPSFVFFCLMLISLIFYFLLPDTNRNASFVSVRTCMMIFFFFILCLAQVPIKRKWVIISLGVITVLISFWRLKHINDVSGKLNQDVMSLRYIDQFILPEKVIIPIDLSQNWLYGHLLNYIAVTKPVLLLENYEASKKYFPVLWNEKTFPNYTIGNLTQNDVPCIYWRTNPSGLKLPSDYILVNGSIAHSSDSCISGAYNEILSSYKWVTNSGNFTLYCKQE